MMSSRASHLLTALFLIVIGFIFLSIKLDYNNDIIPSANISKSFMDLLYHQRRKLTTSAPTPAPCSPHKSLSYVKIHKTGSGAMHNLLIRLALRYNLTVALPHCQVDKNSYQMFPHKANKQYMLNQAPLKDYHNYNVFLDHAVHDKNVQMEYMAEDVRFLTQIRHPFSQAVSGFQHFHASLPHHGMAGKDLTTFLNSHHKEAMFYGNCFNTSQITAPITTNFQVFALGYADAKKNNITLFKSYLQKLDDELFFVSLLEYSDESSILLRRKMCWHIRDVLNIQTHKTKKSNINKTENASRMVAKEQAKRLHKQWSALDYMLYDHFKEKLLKLIGLQDPDFQEEVQHYKALNARFSQLCTTMCEDFSNIDASNITLIRNMLHEGVDIPATSFYSAFRLTYIDCLLQKSREPDAKKVLKVHQYPIACKVQHIRHLYRLDPLDCDFSNHVYPGYHINHFKRFFLNKDVCLGNFYNG